MTSKFSETVLDQFLKLYILGLVPKLSSSSFVLHYFYFLGLVLPYCLGFGPALSFEFGLVLNNNLGKKAGTKNAGAQKPGLWRGRWGNRKENGQRKAKRVLGKRINVHTLYLYILASIFRDN